MRTGTCARGLGLLVVLGVVLSVGWLSGAGERIDGVTTGRWIEVQGVRLAKYGAPVAVMGQLTLDAEPVPGTFFFLFYDPLGTNGEEQCGLQLEHRFPEGTVANGAQVSFIQYPNALVTFDIAPSQFRQTYLYDLPFLPEDPPGAAALEFF